MSTVALSPSRFSLSKPGVALSAAALLMLPLWTAWATALGSKPHYEFFPILVLGVAFLVRQRLLEVDESTLRPGHPAFSAIMGLFSIPCLFIGYFQPSAVLAFAGTVAAFSMVMHILGGWSLVRKISPAFVLLAVITPPPGELDTVLTLRLQRISVVIASRTLDMFDIFHVVNMNTLEVDGQRFLVEEACSGIQSLFSILAFALFYALWNQRGFLLTSLLLVGAVIFDLSLNVLRICLGVIAKITGDIDLLNGWPHEILGIVVFVLGLTLTLSWDVVLMEISSAKFFSISKLGKLIRRVFPGKAGQSMRSGGSDRSRSESTKSTQTGSISLKPPRKAFAAILVAWAVLVLPLTAMASIRFAREKIRSTNAKVDDTVKLALESKGEDRLKRLEDLTKKTRPTFAPPEKIGSWTLLPESIKSSERTLSFGSNSESFVYQNGKIQAQISIDYPFFGYHDLNICYDMGGWKVQVMQAENTGSTKEVPYNVSVITRGIDQKGLLIYSAFLENGNWKLEPPEARYDVETEGGQGLFGNLVTRAKYRFGKMISDIPAMIKGATAPTVDNYYRNYQLQAMFVSTDNPSKEQRELLQSFFREAAPVFKQKFLESTKTATPAK
jgi:exosortase